MDPTGGGFGINVSPLIFANLPYGHAEASDPVQKSHDATILFAAWETKHNAAKAITDNMVILVF